jgi:hypothetical protein
VSPFPSDPPVGCRLGKRRIGIRASTDHNRSYRGRSEREQTQLPAAEGAAFSISLASDDRANQVPFLRSVSLS